MELLRSKAGERSVRLDPRTKMVMLFAVSTVLLLGGNGGAMFAVRTAMLLSFWIGALVTVLGIALAEPLLRALLALGVEPAGIVFDTAVAAYLLDATRGAYALPQLAQDTVQNILHDNNRLQETELFVAAQNRVVADSPLPAVLDLK